MNQYKKLIRPILFGLDAERAHELAILGLKTGLVPRAKSITDDRLVSATKDQRLSIGVLFIDIDHFKALNEQYLHTEVDKSIFPEFQNLLKHMVAYRGASYRYGGEEFIVLLPNHDLEETISFANKIRETVESQRFQIASSIQTITVSIGVATRPDHGNTLDELMTKANKAEHDAKSEGRNRVNIARQI